MTVSCPLVIAALVVVLVVVVSLVRDHRRTRGVGRRPRCDCPVCCSDDDDDEERYIYG